MGRPTRAEARREEPAQGPLGEALWVSADVTLARRGDRDGLAGALAHDARRLRLPRRHLGAGLAQGRRARPPLRPRPRRRWSSPASCSLPSSRAQAGGRLRVGLRAMAIIAVPFFFGWRAWWLHMPSLHFSLAREAGRGGERSARAALRHRAAGGGLLPRLPAVAPRRSAGRRAGASSAPRSARAGSSPPRSSPSVTSRPSTLPTRLAVFFPALVFGWLRARTGRHRRVDDVPHAVQRLLAGARPRVRPLLGRRAARSPVGT